MESAIHFYDDTAGIVYLDSGKSIPVNPSRFTSVDDAIEGISAWAKKNGLIGQNDVIAGY